MMEHSEIFHHEAELSAATVSQSSDCNLTILHLNIRSIRQNFPSLQVLLASMSVKLSCIALSETWLSEHDYLNDYAIDGYTFLCSSRQGKAGGGVCIWISREFEAAVTEVQLAGTESLLVELVSAGKRVCTLLLLYRAPAGDQLAFLCDLEVTLSSMPCGASFLVGDINIDLNPENFQTTSANAYCDLMNKFGFFNLIRTPTRLSSTRNSLLDHIFFNQIIPGITSCTINSGITDHLPCFTAVPLSIRKSFPKRTTITKINYPSLGKSLNALDWDKAVHSKSCEFTAFQQTVSQLINDSSKPASSMATRHKSKFHQPWMTSTLLRMVRARNKLHLKAKAQPWNLSLQHQYRSFRNQVTFEVRKTKATYYQKEFEKCQGNQNDRWKYIKRILNKNRDTPGPSCLSRDGDEITDKREICEELNHFFIHIGENLVSKLPHNSHCFQTYMSHTTTAPLFNFIPTTPSAVLKILNSMKSRKATGYDGITARALKENNALLSTHISKLINQSIESSYFPDCLKIARVMPLFKKGDPKLPSNYRPISILTSLSKIFEKVLASQIRRFFEDQCLFSPYQYGFRQARSTTQAISTLLEKLYTNFDNNEITQGIFLDFSKAFDTIDHSIIISKLSYYNFSNPACHLLQSYLSNRKQYVQIEDSCSALRTMKIGVPQGSILGPLLFLIYINDLMSCSPNLQYLLFADDTNIFSQNTELTRSEISKVDNWCLANKLILNYDKTYQVLFRNVRKTIGNLNFELEINNIKIPAVSCTKFLGINLDEKLTFKAHISHIVRKLNLAIIVMRSLSKKLNKDTMVQLYYTFFYPHLIYGIEFWGHAAATDLQRIVTLQKRVLRIILNLPFNSSVSANFSTLRIMPLDMLIKFRTIMLFTNLYKQQSLDLLMINHNYNTRMNSSNKLIVKPVHTERGKRSILFYGAKLFNQFAYDLELSSPAAAKRVLAGRLWASVGAGAVGSHE